MSENLEKSAESMDAHFARIEQTTTTLQDERATQVRAALVSAQEIESRLQLPVAKLLLEVKHERYWAHWGFASFQDFVETECQFSVRKAQELMRVYAKLVLDLEIAPERIAHLGWSKVALCAAKMTPANVETMLKEIEEKSFGQLRAASKTTPKQKQARASRPAKVPSGNWPKCQ